MRRVLLLLPLLAACAQPLPSPPTPPSGPAPGVCHAAPAQFAVGQAYTDRLGEEARRRSGARFLRVVRAGEAVTMEFNAERLTMQLDRAQRVEAARCG